MSHATTMQLRQLRPLVRSTSTETVKTLVEAFIFCRLDYSNSLFYGMSEGLMSQLRYLQNAAACLVSGARRYDHITSVLQELHSLPVQRRVDFQMATRAGLVTIYLSGKAQAYLAARCHLVSDEGRRQLLSSTSRTCRLQGPAETMESLCLQLQVRSCGTAFQLICNKLTLTFNDLNGY